MEQIHLSTIFITHDIDEAILLSDRIYLLTGRPGRITEEICIQEPRPRRSDFNLTDEFLSYKRQILEKLNRGLPGVIKDIKKDPGYGLYSRPGYCILFCFV